MHHALDAPPVLDSRQLAQFTENDPRLAADVLADFITMATHTLDKLDTVTRCEEWQAAVHRLKGAAQSVGAARLALLATHAETALQEQRWPALRAAFIDQFEAVRDIAALVLADVA